MSLILARETTKHYLRTEADQRLRNAGGTAGCVLASRLSENPDVTVLLLEKGRVKDNMLSRVPLMSQNFQFENALQVVSDRFSEPVPNANSLRMKFWSSESIGGASRINGMVMTRGPPGTTTPGLRWGSTTGPGIVWNHTFARAKTLSHIPPLRGEAMMVSRPLLSRQCSAFYSTIF